MLLEVAGWLLGVAMFIRRTAWSRGFTKLGHACVISFKDAAALVMSATVPGDGNRLGEPTPHAFPKVSIGVRV